MSAQAIPLTRLGGKAFNHSANGDAEAEYDRLRDLAREEAKKRNSCFDRAHQAYERGDGAEAKELSTEGKRHAAQMDEYNRQASEFIFRENNAAGRVADDTIDLHGQFVEEAEAIFEARVRDARARGQQHLHVIVGRGNHSVDHVQRLKPRVEQVCRELGLRYETEENAGRIYVDLTGGDAGGGGPGVAQPPPAQHQQHGGSQYQQHPSQQQQQQQQQQEQQEQQEQPGDMVEKIFVKLVKKYCCVVM